LLGSSTGLEREGENGVRTIRKSLEKPHFSVVGFGKGALNKASTARDTMQKFWRALKQI